MMHATARWSVRYGHDLRFAGTHLPRPRVATAASRHGTVPIHVYTDPAWDDARRPVYVHFHGGAWLMRYPEMDDFWCRYVVAEAGVAVVNVDFRTGPYVAYPVAQEECHDAVAWLRDHGAELGLDGSRLAVGGFSSGAGSPPRCASRAVTQDGSLRASRCSACPPSTWPPRSPTDPG